MLKNKNLLYAILILFSVSCTKKIDTTSVQKNTIDCWLTKSDQSVLLQKQSNSLVLGTEINAFQTIEVDEKQTFQTVDGFGFTLTSGSASVINGMKSNDKAALLQELFSTKQTAISYLRISIGASDLSATTYSYDDMPQGQTDENLTKFSLNPDKQDVIPLLKEILSINPKIKILATPWSPPVWMKDTFSFKGGSLQPKYYAVYAQYFVKYIQQMKAEGIDIEAITPQNEPLHPGNNPSLLMLAEQQRDFIKVLAPAFQKANIQTKIIVYDHNCDHPEYPLTILNDPSVKPFVWGSAFHLYNGDISALSKVHDAHPDKHVYFTEQYTGTDGNFGGDLSWHLQNVIIGSMRNWSRTAFEWNLANDPQFGPHTEGGCTTCKGALTIGNQALIRNVAYYIIAHASKFVPAGSVRIGSNITGNLQNVAFLTPDGKKVLIVENSGNTEGVFNIRFKEKCVNTSLAAGAVVTYVW